MTELTKQQIDDMRTSLGKGAQPFTKEAIDSLCALAVRGLAVPEARRSTVALKWAVSIFGEGAEDGEERAMRFIEEAVELVNAVGLSASVVHAIVERIYTRQKGDRGREMGQAMLTLELLAEAYGIDPSRCADVEFARIQAVPKEEWERRHKAKVEAGIAK